MLEPQASLFMRGVNNNIIYNIFILSERYDDRDRRISCWVFMRIRRHDISIPVPIHLHRFRWMSYQLGPVCSCTRKHLDRLELTAHRQDMNVHRTNLNCHRRIVPKQNGT